MHALPEQLLRGDDQSGLFNGLPDRGLLRRLPGLDLPGGELPHQLALGDAAADHEHAAVLDDDGGADAGLGGGGFGHAVASKAVKTGGYIWSVGMNRVSAGSGTQVTSTFSSGSKLAGSPAR